MCDPTDRSKIEIGWTERDSLSNIKKTFYSNNNFGFTDRPDILDIEGMPLVNLQNI